MAEKLLGTDFAIHGGGSDLVFPHHENEIAQTEAARGAPLARIWMHNGMVEIADEKMSKSVGNIFQLSEALDRFGAETLIAYLVSGHYRQPIAFGADALAEAGRRAERLRNYARQAPGGDRGRFRRRNAAKHSSTRSPTTSTRRGRWRRCSSSSPRATGASCRAPARRSRRCCPLIGLESLLVADEPRRPRGRAPAGRARERPRGARLRARRPDPRRARAASAGRSATPTPARASSGAAECPSTRSSTAATPSPRRSAGRRRVHRVLTADDVDAEELTRLAGSPEHQGVVAEVDPYPYAGADELLETARRRDRRPRPGPGPAQPRRRMPLGRNRRRARRRDLRAPRSPGDAGGRARRARARSSTSRSHGCATSPIGSPPRSARGPGSTAPTPARTPATTSPTTTASPCSSSAARARGSGRGWPPHATCWSRSRRAGRVDSLNVSAAAAVLLFEARRRRG